MSCPGPVSQPEAAPPDCTPATPVSSENCRERGHCPQLSRASPGLPDTCQSSCPMLQLSGDPRPPPPRCEIPGSGNLGQSPTARQAATGGGPGLWGGQRPRARVGSRAGRPALWGVIARALALVAERSVLASVWRQCVHGLGRWLTEPLYPRDDGWSAGPGSWSCCWHVSTAEMSPLWG